MQSRFSNLRQSWLKLVTVLLLCIATTGCVGTVVGAVVDTTIEVIKIPFKVGGALIDAVTPDDFTEQAEDSNDDADNDDAAVKMEQEGI